MTADDLKNIATLLRTLAAAEQVRLSPQINLGELDDELRRLMDYIDPIECMSLAALCDVEASMRSHGISTTPPMPRVRQVPCG